MDKIADNKILNNRVTGSSSSITNRNIDNRINRSLEFGKILEQVQGQKDLKISAHAMDRLHERNIELNEKDLTKLKDAVQNIRDKGGKEALILYNNVAFITSIRNNTIITAVDSKNLKDSVFTNIDSAVIL